MATHPSNLAWEIPWTKDPGGLQSMGTRRAEQDLVTNNKHSSTGSKARPNKEEAHEESKWGKS